VLNILALELPAQLFPHSDLPVHKTGGNQAVQNYTLTQTIGRGYRVFPSKRSGCIVDYANAFASLHEASAIYGGDTQKFISGYTEQCFK
jgi:hypothetical protein